MGEPLPYDPEEHPEAEPDPKLKQPERADWLVGAEEGISAEISRSQAGLRSPFIVPKLLRPESGEYPTQRPSDDRVPDQAPIQRMPGMVLPPSAPPSAPRSGHTSGPPSAPSSVPHAPEMPRWDHAQSSIPMLKREREIEAPRAASSPIPELTRDFPMDDAEERARISAEMAERRAEEEAVAARPHAVVKPDEFEIPVVPARGLPNLKTALATDRRVQIAIGVVLAVVLAMTFWPREEKTISVAHLRAEPEKFADTQVRVRGKVVEVFPVGGSWAYSLVQGRDTIVVFTRVRVPKLHEQLVVVGTLSNGYLDGNSRAAIFETNR